MRAVHSTIRVTVPLARVATAVATAACAALMPGWASGQAFDAVRLYGAAPDQNGGTIGLAMVVGREYAGSDERRTRLLPAIDYRWANGWFAGTTNGIGYNFSRDPALQYGLRLTADFGRDEDRSRVLRGLGDVEARPELGAFFNLLPSRNTFVTTSLRYGSGNGRDGLLFDVGTGMSWQPAPAWRMGAGVAATWANAAYQQSYFGVDAAQAARSGLPRTGMGSGVRDVRASVSATYSFHPKAAVTAALSYSRLQGDAARSPVVREAGALGGVVAVSYRF